MQHKPEGVDVLPFPQLVLVRTPEFLAYGVLELGLIILDALE
jgi:hypothetical protein